MKRKLQCEGCGKTFETVQPNRKYCSTQCKQRTWYWRNAVDLRERAKIYRITGNYPKKK